MKKPIRFINVLSLVLGIIFLGVSLLALFIPAFHTKDAKNIPILGGIGIFFIYVALVGDRTPSLLKLEISRLYFGSVWIYLIGGLLFIFLFGALIIFAPGLVQQCLYGDPWWCFKWLSA